MNRVLDNIIAKGIALKIQRSIAEEVALQVILLLSRYRIAWYPTHNNDPRLDSLYEYIMEKYELCELVPHERVTLFFPKDRLPKMLCLQQDTFNTYLARILGYLYVGENYDGMRTEVYTPSYEVNGHSLHSYNIPATHYRALRPKLVEQKSEFEKIFSGPEFRVSFTMLHFGPETRLTCSNEIM